jgi:hypothetical protein
MRSAAQNTGGNFSSGTGLYRLRELFRPGTGAKRRCAQRNTCPRSPMMMHNALCTIIHDPKSVAHRCAAGLPGLEVYNSLYISRVFPELHRVRWVAVANWHRNIRNGYIPSPIWTGLHAIRNTMRRWCCRASVAVALRGDKSTDSYPTTTVEFQY